MKEVGEERRLAASQIWHLEGTPISQALAIRELMEQKKLSQERVAKLLGWQQTRVSARLRLLNLLPELQKRAEKGTLRKSIASKLSGFSHDEQRKFLEADHLTLKDVTSFRRDRIMSKEIMDLLDEPILPEKNLLGGKFYVSSAFPSVWKLDGPFDRTEAEAEFARRKPEPKEVISLLEAKLSKIAEGQK